MTKRVEFLVSFDLPRNCTVKHAQETLMNQIKAMGGDLRPPGGENEEGDPMFEFDHATAEIKHVRKRAS